MLHNIMQCPFGNHFMTSLDNGSPPPRLSMICKQCPHEVRVQSEKDPETEQHWIIRHQSIYVFHRNIQYCLHWNYRDNVFEIMDTSTSTGTKPIISLNILPFINPEEALAKLQTFILFS